MNCKNCGKILPKNVRFCPECGTELPAVRIETASETIRENTLPVNAEGITPALDSGLTNQGPGPLLQGEWISKNILRCNDGVYRWVYELNLLKNPHIFLLLIKIFFFIILGIFAVGIISDLIRWGWDVSSLLSTLKVFGYFLIGMVVLVGISYLVYAAIMGGKYCVMFEMDEKGINHKQMPHQAKKAALLSDLAVLAGLGSGNFTLAGTGFAAARTEMYTDFAGARKLLGYSRRGLIKISKVLDHNQVYVDKEDYDFVYNYMAERCTNLKKKR
ncbi:MAG: zinc ribbon domain-containing protein [Lachnospiraceae bacterium]|nr:zinc ribbon domain-containing protein [Lachnospiraceae bacterium]